MNDNFGDGVGQAIIAITKVSNCLSASNLANQFPLGPQELSKNEKDEKQTQRDGEKEKMENKKHRWKEGERKKKKKRKKERKKERERKKEGKKERKAMTIER